jgi:phage shock protein A
MEELLMSVCDVIEVNNEVYVHISKVEDLGKLKTENDRLHKLISQREKKWEKWTTEKTILSTKMSDYLCKYQNIKREYTKQIKISTDRKREIERLNNIIKDIKSQLDYLETYSSKEDVFEDMKRRLDRIEDIVNRK